MSGYVSAAMAVVTFGSMLSTVAPPDEDSTTMSGWDWLKVWIRVSSDRWATPACPCQNSMWTGPAAPPEGAMWLVPFDVQATPSTTAIAASQTRLTIG